MVNADASRFSTGVTAGQRVTGVDTPDTRFERPCGRNVDGIELGVDALQLLRSLLEISPINNPEAMGSKGAKIRSTQPPRSTPASLLRPIEAVCPQA